MEVVNNDSLGNRQNKVTVVIDIDDGKATTDLHELRDPQRREHETFATTVDAPRDPTSLAKESVSTSR